MHKSQVANVWNVIEKSDDTCLLCMCFVVLESQKSVVVTHQHCEDVPSLVEDLILAIICWWDRG